MKPMSILLIEDDADECKKYINCANSRSDVKLIGTSNSSKEGLKLVVAHLPEGIVLDIELTKGEGDGLQFLKALNRSSLNIKPIIVVTTNIQAEIMYDRLHDMGVTFIFSKKQDDYSPEKVINLLLNLRKTIPGMQKAGKESLTNKSPEKSKAEIIELIDTELNQIGISNRLKGRLYAREAIYLLATKEESGSDAVIYNVASQYKINYNSVIRAIQTVIEKAWSQTDIETLQERYPVHIDINTGVPAPTEFIHYFAGVIRKVIQ